MQRYFAKRDNNLVALSDGDVHHLLHVMRAKVNDEIEAVIDGKLYSAIIKSISPLKIEINYEIPLDSELPNEVTLFFALAKGDKIDTVIQKATELGVARIVLIKTERCVVKYEGKDTNKKLERFSKIAKEASEQSHRLRIPEIVGPINLNDADKYMCDINLLAYEKVAGKTDNIPMELKGKSVSVMIGPEGGFSEKEVELLQKKGFSLISLGKRILRTETAAFYILSVLGFILER